ncbi:MAG: aspartate-semialdehyde dehydrogenase [Oligoflexia bacterium]|nr:aspartate-semialdehyde dehydrogenase [Oligoflexia bacterium]
MSRSPLHVAVVGATGAVGRELLSILDQRDFPVGELTPFASARSQGKMIPWRGRSHACHVLEEGCFEGVDLAFFDASDEVSRVWVPKAVAAGAWVIDNSATFRMDPDVILGVPEVNGPLLARYFENPAQAEPRSRIIAGPNCSTVQLVVALKPLHDRWRLKRVVVSSYQSTSGAGTAAMDELSAQTRGALSGQRVAPRAFPHQIAFNCIPQIGGVKDDGYTSEESKIMAETRKILGLPSLRISATAVRVPTHASHGESVNIEFEEPVSAGEARAALAAHPGIVVQDDPQKGIYPMGNPGEGGAVQGASGRDGVYVGRIRKDPSVENGLNLWVVSDNLRKGAALNAIQIGEILVKRLR